MNELHTRHQVDESWGCFVGHGVKWEEGQMNSFYGALGVGKL